MLHLIKQQAEKRTTRSWDVSIRNAVREIQREKRRTGGYYLTQQELWDLEEAYLNAIDEASLQVEEGRYEPEELEQRINKAQILNHALNLIAPNEI